MNVADRSRLQLAGTDVRILLSHMALYGLAAILEETGHDDVHLGWSGGMQPVAWVSAVRLDEDSAGESIRTHAIAHAGGSWVDREIVLSGSARGVMSPRLSGFSSPQAWYEIQAARQSVLDKLTDEGAVADLRYLAALGEPAYWSRDRTGRTLQDDGASRLEMQPRNQGSEFVGTRLSKVAAAVSARSTEAVIEGLLGRRLVDEVSSDRSDSRTPTGFASPGPTDNALTWCALWGLGQFPTAPRVNKTASCSGHLGRSRAEWFYVPAWQEAWRPAKLRSVLASAQLTAAAGADLHQPWSVSDDRAIAARAWLSARGVRGIVRFPIERFGSDNAPERRAMRGVVLRGAGDP